MGVTLYFLAPMYAGNMILLAPLLFIAAFVVWAVGLLIVGGPAWIVLARLGRTTPAHALLLGLIAPFVVWTVLTLALTADTVGMNDNGRDLIHDGWRTPYGWFVLIKDGVLLALTGGVVGTVIWWIAYPKERSGG